MTDIDVVVAGHICLDVTPQFFAAAGTMGDLFQAGSLLKVGPASISTGGPVSNTGLPLRRLGMNVRLMGKCGDDTFGQALMAAIKAEAPGAEAGMQIVPSEHTSYTVVINPPGLDRMFLHCTGANDTFGADDIDLKTVSAAKLFHFGYPPLMARTYADGGSELVRILQGAKATGATTSLDLAWPDAASPAGKADWKSILRASLPYVDVFTPSVEELVFMLHRGRFEELSRHAGPGGHLLDHIDGETLCDLGELSLEMGAAVVMIKCGRHGIFFRSAGLGRLEQMGRARPADLSPWANRQLFEPAYRVPKVVSATGAGDCAIAGFLAALVRGCSADDAVRTACAVGGQNVTAADAISGVKNWDQTRQQVDSRPEKVRVEIPLPRFRFDDAQQHFTGPMETRS